MTNKLAASYQKYTLIFKEPAGTSRGFLRQKTVWFVRLTDRQNPDRVGVGECAPMAGLSLDDRPDFEQRLAMLCAAINHTGQLSACTPVHWPALNFGVETAYRDLQTGGRRVLFDTPFTRGKTGIPNHGLIWMGNREAMLAKVRQKVEQGVTCIKLKVGALNFTDELALLAEIRQDYPATQLEIRLDANGAFSAADAPHKLEALAKYTIHSLEQPIKPGQIYLLAQVCAASPIPIALDEELIAVRSAMQQEILLNTVKPHFLVLKPSLLGGFAAAQQWITLAQPRNIGWWVNSALESSIGLNAIAQWVSTFSPTIPQGLGTGQLYTNNVPAPIYIQRERMYYKTGSRE